MFKIQTKKNFPKVFLIFNFIKKSLRFLDLKKMLNKKISLKSRKKRFDRKKDSNKI